MTEKQNPEVKQLIKIDKKLEEMNKRAGNTKSVFFYGLLQGAGALVGGVVALVILSWVLSIIGVIPGLGDIAKYLSDAVAHWSAHR